MSWLDFIGFKPEQHKFGLAVTGAVLTGTLGWLGSRAVRRLSPATSIWAMTLACAALGPILAAFVSQMNKGQVIGATLTLGIGYTSVIVGANVLIGRVTILDPVAALLGGTLLLTPISLVALAAFSLYLLCA